MGETSEISRELKDGEVGEWVLLDAVCIFGVVSFYICLHFTDPGDVHKHWTPQFVSWRDRSSNLGSKLWYVSF
jgi:hypothetical protein